MPFKRRFIVLSIEVSSEKQLEFGLSYRESETTTLKNKSKGHVTLTKGTVVSGREDKDAGPAGAGAELAPKGEAVGAGSAPNAPVIVIQSCRLPCSFRVVFCSYLFNGLVGVMTHARH